MLASRIHRLRHGRTDVETMGRVICEANAAGVPVVATETGGIPSVVSHGRNGLLVPPEDPTALSSAVVRLFQQPTLLAHLKREGLQRARAEFDWNVVVDHYEAIFHQARLAWNRDAEVRSGGAQTVMCSC